MSSYAEMLCSRGKQMTADGEPALAARFFLAAHALLPESPRHALDAADCFLQLGEPEAASLLLDGVQPQLLSAAEAAEWPQKREEARALLTARHSSKRATLHGGGDSRGLRALLKGMATAGRLAAHSPLSDAMLKPAEMLSSLAQDAVSEADHAKAASLFVAAHMLRPRHHHFALSAASAFLAMGDAESGTMLLGQIDFSKLLKYSHALTLANNSGIRLAELKVIKLQTAVRGMLARRKYARALRNEYLLTMMVALHTEQAVMVQRRWRWKREQRHRQVELRAALLMQAFIRGHRERKSYPTRKLEHLIISNAARKIQRNARKRFARALILKECCGFIEKQSTLARIGPIQVSVWQVCWVYVTFNELRYQKANKSEERDLEGHRKFELSSSSAIKRVPLSEVFEVRANFDDCVTTIKVKRSLRTRTHRILLNSADETELWAVNLLQLVSLLGAECVGWVEGTNDDGVLEVLKMDGDVLKDARYSQQRRKEMMARQAIASPAPTLSNKRFNAGSTHTAFIEQDFDTAV